MPKRRPVLLCQVSCLADLSVAQYYRVEAVRLGVSAFQLDNPGDGFTWEQLLTALDYCHSHSIESFLDVTFYPQQSVDAESLSAHLRQLSQPPTAFIIHDPGLLKALRKSFSDVNLFLGPLQPIYTVETAQFWANQGICGAFLPWDISLEQLEWLQQEMPPFKWILTLQGYPLQGFVSSSRYVTPSGHCHTTQSQSDERAQHQIHWNQHGLLLYPQNEVSFYTAMPYLYEQNIAYGYLAVMIEPCPEQWKWIYLYRQLRDALGEDSVVNDHLAATQVVGMIREQGQSGAICEIYNQINGAEEVMVLTQEGPLTLQLPSFLEKFDGESVAQVAPRDFIRLPFPDLPVHALIVKKINGTSSYTCDGSAIARA